MAPLSTDMLNMLLCMLLAAGLLFMPMSRLLRTQPLPSYKQSQAVLLGHPQMHVALLACR